MLGLVLPRGTNEAGGGRERSGCFAGVPAFGTRPAGRESRCPSRKEFTVAFSNLLMLSKQLALPFTYLKD
jgi:hypothetical protein